MDPGASAGGFLFPNQTDTNVLADVQTLHQRVEGLMQCARRLGLEAGSQSTWTAVLSDLVALTGALHMTVKEVVPRLQTKSVIPWSPSLDITLYNEIPNLLNVIKAPDDVRELADMPINKPISIKHELVKKKLRQQDATIMDGIKVLQTAVMEWQPPKPINRPTAQPLTVFQLQQTTEQVQALIAAIYSGTTREHF